MACPHFRPGAPSPWSGPGPLPRLTLLDFHVGSCDQDGQEPDANTLAACCSRGYAAGACARLPAGSADAVRFQVARDLGTILELVWVLERDHMPARHGLLDIPLDAAGGSGCLESQGRAFALAWMRRARRRKGAVQ